MSGFSCTTTTPVSKVGAQKAGEWVAHFKQNHCPQALSYGTTQSVLNLIVIALSHYQVPC